MATLPSPNPNLNLTPTTANGLMCVMQEMMRLPFQQFTQMLQQVIQVTQAPPAQVAPAPAPQPSMCKKIRPTFPKYDGMTDTDNHIDLFESIAETKAWTDNDRKQNFCKSLVKTANTWYVRNTATITAEHGPMKNYVSSVFPFVNLLVRPPDLSHVAKTT